MPFNHSVILNWLVVSVVQCSLVAAAQITFATGFYPPSLTPYTPFEGVNRSDTSTTRSSVLKDLPFHLGVRNIPHLNTLRRRMTTPLDVNRMPTSSFIRDGPAFHTHWAYTLPVRPAIPITSNPHWMRNPIDAFVLARLDKEGLRPSPQAPKLTLLRRVTLDLTGLPPGIDDIYNYLRDTSPNAYETRVDQLLHSQAYGERMAVQWLDLARYSDTHGYHIDSKRDMWPWRDWVINAYNANIPFAQFTILQLAGDLLPNATAEQKIATGFNRNHMITFEQGAIPEEYRVEYVADRVTTTATVWLGTTMSCARCHNHKYDPISQKHFYRFFAFFNSVPESGLDGRSGNAVPFLPVPSAAQASRLATLTEAINNLASAQSTIAASMSFNQWLSNLPASVRRSTDTALHNYFFTFVAPKPLRDSYNALEQLTSDRRLLVNSITTSMVMEDMSPPRETWVLGRGDYRNHLERIEPGTPLFLPPPPTQSPANRLTLAHWLISPTTPLTARVTVNRFWQLYFGTGIVATSDDFGSQGDLPSHPQLLDWLATEFIRSGWNVRELQRLIVTSATYRQSSRLRPSVHRRDPENRLLARGPRFRLPAEMIRDVALAASGLLDSDRIGGPSVFPYQPKGLWEDLAVGADSYSAQTYSQSTGRDLYRRSLYTFSKRTAPPPSMAIFDAPDRDTCVARRFATNTPLQALVLLNDPTFVEAARALAQRSIVEGGSTASSRLRYAFLLATGRHPTSPQLTILLHSLGAVNPTTAILSVGDSPQGAPVSPLRLAKYTVVASIILNLYETITKE